MTLRELLLDFDVEIEKLLDQEVGTISARHKHANVAVNAKLESGPVRGMNHLEVEIIVQNY